MEYSEELVRIAGASAVYLLLRGGEVVYVGQSVNVFARVASHYQALARKRKGLGYNTSPHTLSDAQKAMVVFDEVLIKTCLKADLDREELALIQRYLPKHNVRLKRPESKIDLGKLPSYREAVRKAAIREDRVKRRKLPPMVKKLEQEFQRTRDVRRRISLPKLVCLEDEHAS